MQVNGDICLHYILFEGGNNLAKRELIKKWNNVSFHNFPLKLWKETKFGYIYVMDGISLSNNANAIWGGRFRFHTPKMVPDEICKYVWDMRKMKEWVCVDGGKEKEREYFCLENPRSLSPTAAKHFMLFTSNKYEKVASKAELLAKVFCVNGNNKKDLKLLVTTVPFNI